MRGISPYLLSFKKHGGDLYGVISVWIEIHFNHHLSHPLTGFSWQQHTGRDGYFPYQSYKSLRLVKVHDFPCLPCQSQLHSIVYLIEDSST